MASYSLRVSEGAPGATLAWSELAALKKASAFDIVEVPMRLQARRKDPWAGINDIEQELARWSQG